MRREWVAAVTLGIVLAAGGVWFLRSGAQQNKPGRAPEKTMTDASSVHAQTPLPEGANIETRNASGRTPLMLAALKGQTETVRSLLAKGADINARDAVGMTALMWAAFGGNIVIIETLIENGADVHIKDNSGNTALHWGRDHAEVVARLKKAGAR
jgi:ankyrin repeat protein